VKSAGFLIPGDKGRAGLAGTEVSRAAVFLNFVPVSTLSIAAVALGERPVWVQLAGGLLVLRGVYVVSRPAGVTRPSRLHRPSLDPPRRPAP